MSPLEKPPLKVRVRVRARVRVGSAHFRRFERILTLWLFRTHSSLILRASPSHIIMDSSGSIHAQTHLQPEPAPSTPLESDHLSLPASHAQIGQQVPLTAGTLQSNPALAAGRSLGECGGDVLGVSGAAGAGPAKPTCSSMWSLEVNAGCDVAPAMTNRTALTSLMGRATVDDGDEVTSSPPVGLHTVREE